MPAPPLTANEFKYFIGQRSGNRMNKYVAVLWLHQVDKQCPEWLECFAWSLRELNEAIKEHMLDPRNKSCYVICAYDTNRPLHMEEKTETIPIPVVTKKWTEVS